MQLNTYLSVKHPCMIPNIMDTMATISAMNLYAFAIPMQGSLNTKFNGINNTNMNMNMMNTNRYYNNMNNIIN